MWAVIAIVVFVAAAIAEFALKQKLDYEITIRRQAPSIFGWLTLWPILGVMSWLYVRARYPVVDSGRTPR